MCTICERLEKDEKVELVRTKKFIRDMSKRFYTSFDLVFNKIMINKEEDVITKKNKYVLWSVSGTTKDEYESFNQCIINYCPICGRKLGDKNGD